ncbi:mitochondrial intermediate peptidase, mitochondrial-like isoform X2 [Magnolia sinica]|uniref:mitochondrial intermediate peptidase, mitochondrial-like isoform X2 n=1 Tax=Magnolia sinica TaxID=86752 RepID=UPI002657F1AF|nr:mitochondrial intermediate peptidase, mitochondrial-like isoform X2 [Magnolia sinica]
MFFKGFILLHFNSVHNFVIACTMCSSLLPSILSACLCDQCIDLELISHSFGFSFSENIITDPGFVDIFPASRMPKHMQHLLKPIYHTMTGASKEPLGSRDTVKEKGFRVTTDPGTLSSILKWASDAEVRKQSYISGNSVPHANLGVLDKLIAARHELAKIMGYKSYAQFAVHPNIASSREVVMPFLLDLSKIVTHKADEVNLCPFLGVVLIFFPIFSVVVECEVFLVLSGCLFSLCRSLRQLGTSRGKYAMKIVQTWSHGMKLISRE